MVNLFKKFRERRTLWSKIRNTKKSRIGCWRNAETGKLYPVPHIKIKKKEKMNISSRRTQILCQLFLFSYSIILSMVYSTIMNLEGFIYTLITSGIAFGLFFFYNEIICDLFNDLREEK